MNYQVKAHIFIIINVIIIFTVTIFMFFLQHSDYLIFVSIAAAILNIIGFWIFINAEGYKNKTITNLKQQIESLEQNHQQQLHYIKQQEEEINKQIDSIKDQINIIELQKKELEDSITYAYRIQQTILPPKSYIDQILSDYFIFYIPKSIVSGDFYFIVQEGEYTIISAVDCTGHGISGAMMSVFGYDLLNRAVKLNHITKPSEILSFVDEGVTNFLRQMNDESEVHDGMDISIISIYKQLRIVEFAGAYHKLFYSHNGEILEIQGDKLPIGMNVDGVVHQYTNHGVPVNKGDMLYLLSDGYANQFGGKHNKKFKYKALKKLLLEISNRDCKEQKEILAHQFIEWQGSNEQVDDILIIGIRV